MTAYFGLYAKGVTQSQTTIPTLEEEGTYGGQVRSQYDTFTLTADLANGDTIAMGSVIPEVSRIVDQWMTTGALGGSCAIESGWAAGLLGITAASAAGFFAAQVVSSASVIKLSTAGIPAVGIYGSFLLDTLPVQLQCTVASSGATGKVIQLETFYVDL